MPPAERFAHGTRARYTSGCRCDACRAANTQYARDCAARAKARAAEVVATQPATVTKAHGALVRSYKRACIGINGEPCPTSSYLRKDSTGDICSKCRVRRSYRGLVSAERARAHLLELQAAGVGKLAVRDACDVPASMLHDIRRGAKARIRVETEARILAVDVGAIADGAIVPAAETWRLLNELLGLGIPKYKLARVLGSKAERAMPQPQVRPNAVLAKTEQRVRRLHGQLLTEVRRNLELREDVAAAAAKGKEWFDGDSYSVIRRGGARG